MSTNHIETLQDLARLAFDRNGGGGRVQEAKLANSEHSMVRTTFDHILAGTYNHRPSRRTLEALAYLAGVPAERAYAAAGRKQAKATFADMLPPDVDDLNDDQRRAVIEVARAFLKTNKELEGLRHDLEQQNPPEPLRFPSRGDAVAGGAEPRQEVTAEELEKIPAKTRKGKRQRELIDATFPDDESSQDPDDHA